MRIVKLGSRYVLAQNGFTHAVRFDRQCRASDAIKKALHRLHPNEDPWNQWWPRHHQDAAWGSYKNTKSPSAPYWIGVKNLSDLTAALLMTEHV